MTYSFNGSGPGPIAPDGCPVELYRLLPYKNELAEIESHLLACRTVLELGCGTGRHSRRLLELGLQVSGVDASAEMLTFMPPGAECIQSTIEDLALGRTWEAVMLASQMINHPVRDVRTQFVRTARRHLSHAGLFILKRHDPKWLAEVQDGPVGVAGGIGTSVQGVERHDGVVSMTLRYTAGENEWTQSFATEALETDEIDQLLKREGFTDVLWCGSERLWAVASDGYRAKVPIEFPSTPGSDCTHGF